MHVWRGLLVPPEHQIQVASRFIGSHRAAGFGFMGVWVHESTMFSCAMRFLCDLLRVGPVRVFFCHGIVDP